MKSYLFFLCFLLSISCFQCDQLRTLTEPSTTSRNATASSSQLRQNVVSFALDQRGVTYQYGGRSPRSGFDCSGFTHYVYDNFNLELTPVSRVQETEGQRIRLSEAQAGDLVFFRKSSGGAVFHVALVVENGAGGLVVVHSTSLRGVIRENITNSSYWKPKLSTARTYF